jgi:hypothetical protein
MFNSIADNYTLRMAEARAMEWMQRRGLHRDDSISAAQLPAILIEFSNAMNEEMKRICNHYQKIAADALNLKISAPFIIDEPAGDKQ